MALFIGSTIVVLCMVQVALTKNLCSDNGGWGDLGNDLDPRLLAYVAERNTYGSFAISGHSLVTPLEMLVMAAEGETRKQIAKALRMQPGQEIIPTNLDCKSHNHKIGNFTEASKLFLGKQYEHNDIYEEAIKKVLHSEVGTVDFHNPSAAAYTIDKWISDNTDHKIDYLVSPFDLSRNSTAVIANALLIKSEWQTPFNPNYTVLEDFYSPTEEPFMNRVDYVWIRDVQSMDATAVYIPLKEVKANMVLVLPNKADGLQRVLESLSHDEKLQGPAYQEWIQLSVPKFEIYSDVELIDFLRSIGVVDVFTKKSELPHLTREGKKVHITDFIQKSLIRIDEKGVNAATANENVVDPTKEPKTRSNRPLREIAFNHPFYYGFTESYTSEKIYFGGVYRGW